MTGQDGVSLHIAREQTELKCTLKDLAVQMKSTKVIYNKI